MHCENNFAVFKVFSSKLENEEGINNDENYIDLSSDSDIEDHFCYSKQEIEKMKNEE